MNLDPIVIIVPGKPESQRRARVRAFTDKQGRARAQVYDPAVSREWKQAARQYAAVAMRGRPVLLGPVAIMVVALIAPPRSWPDWKRAAALAQRIMPTGVPDTDNLAKAAKDALKSVVWQDDAQVVEEIVTKEYRERPSLRIVVTPQAAAPANIPSKAALGAWLEGTA